MYLLTTVNLFSLSWLNWFVYFSFMGVKVDDSNTRTTVFLKILTVFVFSVSNYFELWLNF